MKFLKEFSSCGHDLHILWFSQYSPKISDRHLINLCIPESRDFVEKKSLMFFMFDHAITYSMKQFVCETDGFLWTGASFSIDYFLNSFLDLLRFRFDQSPGKFLLDGVQCIMCGLL
jgi:hypothetical protein